MSLGERSGDLPSVHSAPIARPDFDQLRDAISRVCVNDTRVVAVYLYGSALRPDYRPSSDVDVLVIIDDDASVTAIREIGAAFATCWPRIDLTMLKRAEVASGRHHGWSRHYYCNVRRTGVLAFGPDAIAPALVHLPTFEEAHRRITQLCQRARMVLLNASKGAEADFWLGKYQHWVPLCLMELLDLSGAPESQLHQAQATFEAIFPGAGSLISYPYTSLAEVHEFLEQLAGWAAANAHLFKAPSGSGVNT